MNEVDSSNQELIGSKLKSPRKVPYAGVLGIPKLGTKKKSAKKKVFRKG
jgi:hypothetical protein